MARHSKTELICQHFVVLMLVPPQPRAARGQCQTHGAVFRAHPALEKPGNGSGGGSDGLVCAGSSLPRLEPALGPSFCWDCSGAGIEGVPAAPGKTTTFLWLG